MGSCVHALWRGPVDSSAGTPGKRSLLLLHQGVTAVLTGPRTTLESLIYHLILLGNSKLEGVSSNAALQIQDVSIARYKAQESIIERISAIDKRSLPRPLALSAEELRKVLKRPNTVLLFATPQESSFEVLGYLLAFQNRLALHLSKVVIAEPYRRRGIAKKLIQEALSSTKKSFATLHVDPQNTPATLLYSSLGFELDGVLEGYYAAGKAAHKLQKQLS